MCGNFKFCVGDTILITNARATALECANAPTTEGFVISIAVMPPAPTVCIIGVKGSDGVVQRHTLLQSVPPADFHLKNAVLFSKPGKKEFHLCKAVSPSHQKQQSSCTDAMRRQQNVSVLTSSKHNRIVLVLRLLFEEKIYKFKDVKALRKENRKAGRRSSLSFTATFTLSEWEHLVAHVNRISSGPVINTPSFQSVQFPRFTEKEMTVEVVDFLTLMRSLGHIDAQRIAKYVVISRRFKQASSLNSPLFLRLIGDYVCEEPTISGSEHFEAAVDAECVVSVGSSLSSVNSPVLLSEEHNTVALIRPSCAWDPRDRAYISPLELHSVESTELLSKLSSETRERNRMVVTGEKRKKREKRFMGFKWTRRSRLDSRTLFYDDADADGIVGDIELCLPTLTFFGGTTATEINALCEMGEGNNLFQLLSKGCSHSLA